MKTKSTPNQLIDAVYQFTIDEFNNRNDLQELLTFAQEMKHHYGGRQLIDLPQWVVVIYEKIKYHE